ncbi:hypothetical protein MKW92_012545 [Papaver armeniacum]|nr:hypothetical protein MKW92_012545 [Papaver armeniacum]
MEEVSPIVQQPHVSHGGVHMKDAVKEGNVTEEQASDAAFNTWSDGDMEVDLEEEARDAALILGPMVIFGRIGWINFSVWW